MRLRVLGSTALTRPVSSARVSQSCQTWSLRFRAGSANLRIDLRPACGRARLDDRPVFLDDPPLLELNREPSGRLLGLGPENHARSGPIEPVDDPEVDRMRDRPDRDSVAPPFPECLRPRCPATLGELAGRLVECQAMLVFEQDGQRLVQVPLTSCKRASGVIRCRASDVARLDLRTTRRSWRSHYWLGARPAVPVGPYLSAVGIP